MNDVHTEVLRTAEALAALRDEWTELHDRDASATTFQRPEWILPWTLRFADGELCAVAVRDGTVLVGLAPLTRRSSQRELVFVGSGNSDYLDGIVDTECAPAVLAEIAGALGRLGGWERACFEHLAPDAAFRDVPTPAGCHARVEPQDRCPVVRLPASIEALFDRLSPGFVRRIRYAQRRAEREGLRIRSMENSDVLTGLDILAGLHEQRWRERGEAGVMNDARVRGFLTAVATELSASGRLLLRVVDVSGCPAAALLGFRDRDRYRFYIGGFAPAYKHVSPGALLLAHVMEEAIRDGAREFDFLRGAERYKYDWGAVDRVSVRRTLWREHGVAQ